jgi:hypothetical protein
LQLFEQHCELLVQLAPTGSRVQQAGSAAHCGSAQSVRPSQSLSRPSWQVEPGTSPDAQPLQSTPQLAVVSSPSHAPSPQHDAGAGPETQALPQRLSAQVTGSGTPVPLLQQ